MALKTPGERAKMKTIENIRPGQSSTGDINTRRLHSQKYHAPTGSFPSSGCSRFVIGQRHNPRGDVGRASSLKIPGNFLNAANMKTQKIFCLALVILGVASRILAAPVNQEKASLVATTFVNGEKARWQQKPETTPARFGAKGEAAAAQAYVIKEVKEIKSNDGITTAYVAELSPEGFVIISADDEIKPVLGFSFQGQFPFTESGYNALLHLVKWDTAGRLKALREARAKGITMKQANLATQKWTSYLSAAKPGGAQPLTPSPMTFQQWPPNQDGWLTTNWYQGSPFNLDCPYIASGIVTGRCPVGCVATAMAQILNYWQYPKSASFNSSDAYISHGGNLLETIDISIDTNSASYDFKTFSQLNSLLSTITYNPTNLDELAALCFGVGVKLKMNYGQISDGNLESGTWCSDAAYKNGFSYGSATLRNSGDWINYGNGLWNSYVTNVIANMKSGWPVQIAIFTGDLVGAGGHSVVLDGYRTDGYFHVNLGWGNWGTNWGPNGMNAGTWYNLPSIDTRTNGEPWDFEIIKQIVYDIAPYQGWSQVGADALNSYRTYYSAPGATPVTKWQVTTNALTYSISGVIVGTSDRVYACLDSMAPSASSQIWVIDPFGTVLQQVNLPSTENDQVLSAPVQVPDGNIFVGSQSGNIYELNPNTDALTKLYSDPNQRIIGAPLKADTGNHLYVTANQLNPGDGDRLYCFDSGNNLLWTFAPSSSETLDVGQPAIDDSNSRVFISSLNQSAQTSYVYELNRTNGAVEAKASFSNSGTFSAEGPISLGPDGTPYIVIGSTLYAFNPTNSLSVKWSKVFSGETYLAMNLAIGTGGTIYVPLHASSTVVALVALDPTLGAQKWQISLPASANDSIVQPYMTAGGIIVFSQNHFNSHTFTHFAYQDNGPSATPLWDYNTTSYGGSKAFGPGDTIYLFPYNSAGQTLTAISDGAVGDPEGAGMGFVNNEPPNAPSIVSPLDETNGVGSSVTLSWQCSDPLGHALYYGLSVCPIVSGNDGVFIPITNGLTATAFALTNLEPGVKYLWNVIASDGQAITQGPVWAFTTQPLPQLAISATANNVSISWSTNATGFVLESSTNIDPSAVWNQVLIAPVLSGSNNIVTDSIKAKTMFYRLRD